MGKIIFKSILCVFLPFISLAQFEPIRNFSVKDGLPSGVVYDCLQDKQGFMWFATAAGLARFDGANFKIFTTENGLTNNEVLQIALDKDGSIWIFPFGATACIYDPVTQKLYNEKNYAELKKVKNLFVQLLVRNSAAGLVGYTVQETFFFENKKINISDVRESKDLWIINKDSLIFFFKEKKSYLFARGEKSSIDFPAPEINTVFSRSPDWGKWKVFIDSSLTRLSLYQYTNEGLIKQNGSFVSKYFINNVNKYGGKIYLPTINGVYVTDTSMRQTDYFFSGKNISKAYVDKSGNEWLCSLSGEGVYMRLQNDVKQYTVTSGLPNANVISVKITQDNVPLCGDGNGNVYKIDPANQIIRPSILGKFPETVRGIELYKNSFIAYSNYQILVNNKIIPENFGAIKCVIADTNGNLLIGAHQRLELYDILRKKNEIIEHDPRFVTLCYSQGNLYYGNNKGLFKIKSLKPYSETPVDSASEVLRRPINHLFSTKDGIVWIATNNDGIVAVKSDKIIGHFNTSSVPSITSNICKKIFSDEENHTLWVATNKGINRIRYTLSGNHLRIFISAVTSSEGLNDDDVNDICVKNGKVYAATIKGLCIFNADLSRKEVPIVVTDVVIKKYSPPDTTTFLQRNYNLEYWQNNISISYSGICYTCDKKFNYQYRLIRNGGDTSWKSTTANTVEFGELLTGNYTFQVRTDAANMQEIYFLIGPAFWQTGLFYGLLAIALAGVFFFSVRFFTRQIRKRELEKTAVNKKFAELEFQALQAQMNPHFVFNAMNTLQNYILKNESEQASEYLAKFARLMRLFLDASRNKFIELGNEIELLKNYIELEQARLMHSFQYQIKIEPGVEMYTKIPSVIIQPFVENAILHGLRHRNDHRGLLKLFFGIHDNTLECHIQDNGIGRHKAALINKTKEKQYQSQGIKIIDEKVKTLKEINNIDIHISIQDNISEDEQASGTTVRIRFDLNN